MKIRVRKLPTVAKNKNVLIGIQEQNALFDTYHNQYLSFEIIINTNA